LPLWNGFKDAPGDGYRQTIAKDDPVAGDRIRYRGTPQGRDCPGLEGFGAVTSRRNIIVTLALAGLIEALMARSVQQGTKKAPDDAGAFQLLI